MLFWGCRWEGLSQGGAESYAGVCGGRPGLLLPVAWWALWKHRLGAQGSSGAAEAACEQSVVKECFTDSRNHREVPQGMGAERRGPSGSLGAFGGWRSGQWGPAERGHHARRCFSGATLGSLVSEKAWGSQTGGPGDQALLRHLLGLPVSSGGPAPTHLAVCVCAALEKKAGRQGREELIKKGLLEMVEQGKWGQGRWGAG